jgi:penicillin amidase
MGWTIVGKLPQRVGFDGRFPVARTYGDRRWDGFLPASKVPTILLPASANDAAPVPGSVPPSPLAESGRLWTANNRVLGGDALTVLGDGGYASPPRAAQIRDRLAALEHATPRDLLTLQLDDRAFYLDRWQKLLLATLSPDAIRRHDSRAELRALVEKWTGYAATDSVSYRLVRDFRAAVVALTFTPLFERCLAQTPQFDWRGFNYEAPLWTLLQQQPAHLLSPAFSSWDELLLTAADRVITETEADGPLDQATWGRRNTAHITHPLSRSLPRWAARWLDLPADQLPGDSHTPRIQRPSFGASMRLVVSPGREDEGLFEMVGGQSGHPLSPFYRAGHDAWVRGEPMPLLPGETRHTLTLTPAP